MKAGRFIKSLVAILIIESNSIDISLEIVSQFLSPSIKFAWLVISSGFCFCSEKFFEVFFSH